MRQIRLLILLSVISLITIKAQNILTLDEAINMAYQKNIELQNQSANVRYAEINLDGSSRLPNPLFSYSREDLKSNSLNYNEWIMSGSIPLNFLWNRWSNIESKEKSIEAQEILFNHLKWVTAAQVRANYFTLHNYSDLSKKLNNTLIRITELSESAKHRLDEGDISEYELQRILIELHKLKSTTSKIELQKSKHEISLKLLIGLDVDEDILTELSMLDKDIKYDKEELIDIAFNSRNDLKSFQLIIESENLFLAHNKLKIIPNINILAGYKKQADDFNGTVFQLDFEIPLFNRNQTSIQQSEIGISLLEKELLFLKEKIKAEVSETFTSYLVNRSLLEGRKDIQLENIFSTAAYSYEQGEISLVELIDGINAFFDGSILANEVITKYRQSFYELEKVVGISLTNF